MAFLLLPTQNILDNYMAFNTSDSDEIAFRINADVRKTNAAPILTALQWYQDYDGKYGERLLLTQVANPSLLIACSSDISG